MTGERRPPQPQDIFGVRSASDAQPSPDGQQIAFVVSELDRAGDQVRTSIWLVAADGGAPQRLTDPAHNSSQPRWSPDGATLAFVSRRESGAQIWLLPVAGGEARRVTDVPGGVTGPAVWSADGRRIAFTARVSSSEAGAPRVIRRLRYLLNGEGYIGDGFWHIFVVSLDDPAVIRLTDGDWHHFAPAWSPDGASITCVTTRRDDWDTEWVWDIYVFDALNADAPPRCLTRSQGTCAAPAWSPDGAWIAYFDNQCPGTAYTQDYHMFIVPASEGSGVPRNLSGVLDRGCQIFQPPATNEPPRWSADSRSIFFHVREAGFYHYYACDVASGQLRPLFSSRDIAEPVAGFVRASADGGVLAVAAPTAVRPGEVYALDGIGKRYRQLTDLNGDLLSRVDVRTPRRLTQTSPEGWEVESWLWLPPGHSDGDGPLPTVLYYHGGPHNTVALGFNVQLHMLAAAGFAVVGVNFRGSTGFGAAFADCILRDWGTRELEDGLAIVNALVQQGICDPKRVGVYGGSFGGYMTNVALSRSDRFAAGASYATISGLHSWSYVTDHWESVDWDMGGPPWEISEYYHSHSPLTFVRDIHAPLLILHGEEDYRCSVSEADQLFGALRKLKRTVELVRYPGASHGFSNIGKPSHQLDFIQRVVEWFQRYLSS